MKREYGTIVRLLLEIRSIKPRTRLFAAVVWMGLIFLASSLPGSATGPDVPLWNLFLKVLHFMNFGVLALVFLALLLPWRGSSATALPSYAASFLLAVLYAVSDECHQTFSPGRHASVKDVIIDAAGAGVFLAACYLATAAPGRAGGKTEKENGK